MDNEQIETCIAEPLTADPISVLTAMRKDRDSAARWADLASESLRKAKEHACDARDASVFDRLHHARASASMQAMNAATAAKRAAEASASAWSRFVYLMPDGSHAGLASEYCHAAASDARFAADAAALAIEAINA